MDARTDQPETRDKDTRERILDAAERLFMAHGFEAASMRMLTTEAGVNLAAVNYHFGGKEGLKQEVFRRRLTALNQGRLAALDALEAAMGGAPLKPSQILDAFFGVAMRMAADTEQGGAVFMRLLGRTVSEPGEFIRKFMADEYEEVRERFTSAMFRALPDVPREEILWRFHFMLGASSYALAGTRALQVMTGPLDDDPAAMAPRLMAFLLGGLRAPLPDPAGEAARERP